MKHDFQEHLLLFALGLNTPGSSLNTARKNHRYDKNAIQLIVEFLVPAREYGQGKLAAIDITCHPVSGNIYLLRDRAIDVFSRDMKTRLHTFVLFLKRDTLATVGLIQPKNIAFDDQPPHTLFVSEKMRRVHRFASICTFVDKTFSTDNINLCMTVHAQRVYIGHLFHVRVYDGTTGAECHMAFDMHASQLYWDRQLDCLGAYVFDDETKEQHVICVTPPEGQPPVYTKTAVHTFNRLPFMSLCPMPPPYIGPMLMMVRCHNNKKAVALRMIDRSYEYDSAPWWVCLNGGHDNYGRMVVSPVSGSLFVIDDLSRCVLAFRLTPAFFVLLTPPDFIDPDAPS